MRNYSRLVLSLAAAFLLTIPFSSLVARESGRDYARCTNACNEIRQSCDKNCQVECKEMFPNNASAERSCQTACKDSCLSEEKDCKLRCKAIKNGETIEEP